MADQPATTRYGRITRLRDGAIEEYRRLHERVWPSVLDAISPAGIGRHSIYHHDGWLFSYVELTGADFEADMERLSRVPACIEWESACEHLRQPGESGETTGWQYMEEVFHHP